MTRLNSIYSDYFTDTEFGATRIRGVRKKLSPKAQEVLKKILMYQKSIKK